MPLGPRIVSLYRSLFGKAALDRDLDDELRGYIDEITERKIAAGLGRDEARRLALAEAGGIESVKEGVRERRIGAGLSATARDVRYGLRALSRSPGFFVTAVSVLALGIGAGVAVLSLIDGVLRRPLPYPEPGRLVVLRVETKGVADAGISPGEARDIRERSRMLDHVAVFSGIEAHVAFGDEVELVAAASVSDDVLPLLGAAPPVLGRTWNVDSDLPGRAVMISHRLWRTRFQADPATVGRSIVVNNRERAVIGVLPPGLRVYLPRSSNAAEEIDVWFHSELVDARTYRGLFAFARLSAGASVEQAQAELDTLAARFLADHPEAYPEQSLRLEARPLREELTRDVGPALSALAAAVGLVLLIACLNVANLMLARARVREREMAIRQALGAGRLRLFRQLFVESLLIAGAASAGGLALAWLSLEWVGRLQPGTLPLQSRIAWDANLAGYAVAVCAATTLLFGVAPALISSAARGIEALRAGRSGDGSPSAAKLRRALVAAEIALSIVPLVAAGLMLRTFVHLVETPVGFNPERIVTARMPVSLRMFPDVDSRLDYYRRALSAVGDVPGIEAVTAASPLPFSRLDATARYAAGDASGRADASGLEAVESAFAVATRQTVLPGYLSLTGTPLLAGRDFSDADVAARRPVVIVDERIARAADPDGAGADNALGRGLRVEFGGRTRTLEIIGVTGAVRVRGAREVRRPHLLLPYHVYPIEMSLLARSGRPAEALAPEIERRIEALGAGRAVHDVRPLSAYLDDSLRGARFSVWALGGFAACALLLTAIGLYGACAYLTLSRTREFGVRRALGAGAGRLAGLVLRESLTLTAVGSVIGLAGAYWTVEAVRGMLYGVEPFDPATLLAVVAAVALTGVAASVGPALRAMRIDPNAALRGE